MFLTWVDGKDNQTASEKLQFCTILRNLNLFFKLLLSACIIPSEIFKNQTKICYKFV